MDATAGVASEQGRAYQQTFNQANKYQTMGDTESDPEQLKYYEEATQLIRYRKISPSRYALHKWVKEKNPEGLPDSTIRAWQNKWSKLDLIELYRLANGKHSYRLKESFS